ncbi:phage portal protein [Leucobacter sp. OAMLP11]|uniref:phage portal protein n=3 Tax=Bacteria TaxID=2 RepID=UPI000C1A3125|nr:MULTISPECIES: phage portal protein [unclassified Leucobacter]PII81568.1 hypothetical protein BMH25_13660 [Leucobacter sp. OLCALW19]PII90135.1 hypothetical protein BMH27_12245 [Leucobacter sp. OLAS13]PII97168.1 hypothetical protein BMH29_12930 [Leucobacter sp. OLDS2]PIJ00018.1 hypothetical protein BMH28_09755 [Leucobacter sp. OLCS4]PIO49617.1 phage portal protein [Leucobacter sp. OAMLP11]
MSILTTALEWLTAPMTRAAKLTAAAPELPVRSDRITSVSPEAALSLSTVYRGVQIHATAGMQLSIRAERDDVRIPTPSIIERPCMEMHRPAWIEYNITSLYLDGNAFWVIERFGPGTRRPGTVSNITVLDPNEVTVKVERLPLGRKRITYYHLGRKINGEVKHLQLLRVPGLDRGLGPIQAAQMELRGALDARDYGAMWLSDQSMPDGVLTTDQVLAPGDADKYKHVWYGRNPDGSKRTAAEGAVAFGPTERLRVMGSGLRYQPLMLKPSDVQFLETQQFTTTQVARLLGTPASLLLAAVEGNSQTYSNVEQDWIGYVRFSLMKPLREIEEALSELLPAGQRARFNVDALLRTDTKTRYEAHNLALAGRWKTRSEVRADEGLMPIDGIDDQPEPAPAEPATDPAPETEPTA